jgi:PAS domain S-box-containing protein
VETKPNKSVFFYLSQIFILFFYFTHNVLDLIENLSKDVLEALLDTLPVDLSFVDDKDTVKYFNKQGNRIFPRIQSVIGLKVQKCHPQKSVHKVQQILDAFKAGKRDVAEFWIQLKDKIIYIRYFPVRDKAGKYLGCLEVSQDITDVKNLEGEKRLLD